MGNIKVKNAFMINKFLQDFKKISNIYKKSTCFTMNLLILNCIEIVNDFIDKSLIVKWSKQE